jgi:hypothetical protein
MPTGIKIENSKNIRIFGGRISGFDKGIEVINSDVTIAGTTFRRCNVAIDMQNSDVLLNKPIFEDNIVDLIVNKSNARLINTETKKIIAVTPKNDIRINPFAVEQMAIKVINTKDIIEKKNRYRQLLKYLKAYTHIWAIYSILKEIARLAGYAI